MISGSNLHNFETIIDDRTGGKTLGGESDL